MLIKAEPNLLNFSSTNRFLPLVATNNNAAPSIQPSPLLRLVFLESKSNSDPSFTTHLLQSNIHLFCASLPLIFNSALPFHTIDGPLAQLTNEKRQWLAWLASCPDA